VKDTDPVMWFTPFI